MGRRTDHQQPFVFLTRKPVSHEPQGVLGARTPGRYNPTITGALCREQRGRGQLRQEPLPVQPGTAQPHRPRMTSDGVTWRSHISQDKPDPHTTLLAFQLEFRRNLGGQGLCLLPSSDKAALAPQPWLRQGKDGFSTLPLCSASKGQATDEPERKYKPLQEEVWCLGTDGTSQGSTSSGWSPLGLAIPGDGLGEFSKPPDLLNMPAHRTSQLRSPGSALTHPLMLVTWEGENAERSPRGKSPSCTVDSHLQQRLRVPVCFPPHPDRTLPKR